MKKVFIILTLSIFVFTADNPLNSQNDGWFNGVQAGPDGRFTLKCKKPATWRLPNGKCCKRGMKKKKCIREYRKQSITNAEGAVKNCLPNISGRCRPKMQALANAEAKKFCGAKKGPFGGGNCRTAFSAGWWAGLGFGSANFNR